MQGRFFCGKKRILREMAAIAFSAEEKTADRLRALGFLAEKVSEEAERLEAMAKLDDLLTQIGE